MRQETLLAGDDSPSGDDDEEGGANRRRNGDLPEGGEEGERGPFLHASPSRELFASGGSGGGAESAPPAGFDQPGTDRAAGVSGAEGEGLDLGSIEPPTLQR